jgi:hypothetical protein
MTLTLANPDFTLRPADRVNLHPQTDEQTGRGHLSNSSISTQLNCLRKFGWAYVERLEPIDRPRPLSLGSAFATALQHGDPAAGADTLDRPTADQAEHDRLEIDKAIIRAAAGLYLQRFGAKTNEAREVPYRVRLRSPYTGAWSRTFDLVGRADGVIDHGDYLELIEDKLVGRVDAVQVKKVRLDRQVGLESYGLWRITGKPVRVIRYRWVKKPSIKVRKGETVPAFIDRLTADYLERPEFYSEEEQTFRSADDLLEIEAELWDWAETRRDAMHRGFFSRNTSSCGDFGGCPYLDLCALGDEARSLYRVKPDEEPVIGEPDAA